MGQRNPFVFMFRNRYRDWTNEYAWVEVTAKYEFARSGKLYVNGTYDGKWMWSMGQMWQQRIGEKDYKGIWTGDTNGKLAAEYGIWLSQQALK